MRLVKIVNQVIPNISWEKKEKSNWSQKKDDINNKNLESHS